MDSMDIEHERRLTEVEARSKSNTKRIDNLEALFRSVNSLATSMEVMVTEQRHQTDAISDIRSDVRKLDSKVETIEQKPAKRWDSVVEKILLVVVTAIVTLLLKEIGL